MEFSTILLVAAVVFGLCFLIDKGYTKIFRGQVQHRSGLSVRLSKRYGSMGILMTVLGIAAVFVGMSDSTILVVGGVLLVIVGICLIVYYMTFGIFYDEDSFILTTFGKRSTLYHYRDIRAQQIYMASGNIVVELHMADGRTVQLQSAMTGEEAFLNHAFEAWLVQTGRNRESCSFHDPENSCWFPPVEG